MSPLSASKKNVKSSKKKIWIQRAGAATENHIFSMQKKKKKFNTNLTSKLSGFEYHRTVHLTFRILPAVIHSESGRNKNVLKAVTSNWISSVTTEWGT